VKFGVLLRIARGFQTGFTVQLGPHLLQFSVAN